MNIVLFDPIVNRTNLRPFSDTKPIAAIRWGIHTIEEKWKYYLPATYSFATASYLQPKFPSIIKEKNLYINGSIHPHPQLVEAIKKLQPNQVLVQNNTTLAFWWNSHVALPIPEELDQAYTTYQRIHFTGDLLQLNNKWDLFLHNAHAIKADFQHISKTPPSQQPNDPYTILYNPENIFIEEGVNIKAAILNAEAGPIYIGKDATIEELAVIKGPVCIGQGAHVRVGAHIYQGTTIGPFSKVGGEVCNSVIFEYSNKAHGGFMGHSIIGEWCNLGAYTITSNLRNDYGKVSVWDYKQEDFVPTELQFCGLFLGAYSKCSIHSMFNTGTTAGVSTHLYGTGFFKRFIPSFSKGSPPDQLSTYELEKALNSIDYMMVRRNKALTETDKHILSYLFEEAIATKTQLTI